MDLRQDSTYEVNAVITEERTKELVEEAEEFIRSIRTIVTEGKGKTHEKPSKG